MKPANKNARKKHAPNSIRWKQILLGFVLGLLFPSIYQWSVGAIQNKPTSISNLINKVSPQAEKIEYDFFNLLPNSTVEVKKNQQEQIKHQYFLRVSSLRNQEKAESQRVELLLLNLPTSVTQQVKGNSTWHQVIVGPFERRTFMSAAKKTLIENGFSPVVLKRPIEK